MGTGRFVGAGSSRHSNSDVAAEESLNKESSSVVVVPMRSERIVMSSC